MASWSIPERALAIGDRWDIRAHDQGDWARRGGVGRLQRAEVAEAGALHVYRDVQEILDEFHTGPLAALLH
jgi:hypothetical protein